MTTEIEITAKIDPQQVYDSLWANEQIDFLRDNLNDLDDDYLVEELESRGYTVTLEKKL
jgi:hypothetical protein